MESSIAPHLVCPRTRTRRIEDDYAPPYPCWSARASTSVEQVVMGYFGVQSRGREMHGKACVALMKMAETFGQTDGPRHHDLAHFVDAQGYDNMIAIAYWDDPAAFARWRSSAKVDAWWSSDERLHDGIGYFREIVSPRVEHYETMFNTPDRLEGVGIAMGSISGDIQEHGYWGSARDRIPLAQTDALSPAGALRVVGDTPAHGRRVRIEGHDNLAIIRSGQEWTETRGKERELYLQDMEPVLREGMNFLRDRGASIGCYSNRYMTHIDAAGKPAEKTFGLSLWRSLGDMERWSESHPTHVAIFGTFMRIVQELQFQLKLRVYHEVAVLKPDEQEYEYIHCHPKTGLLNVLAAA
ncbi:phenylacetaldoxime dehydratase family protein [Variovorax paradoxus]|nr:phenylacetaldoxime dehydratase family protein [Variovorax paradoxus]